MSGLSRREMMFGALLAGLGGVGMLARPPRPAASMVDIQHLLESGMPSTIDGLRPRADPNAVLPPRDAVSQAIYDGFVTRSYVAAGAAPLSVLVAYGAVQDYALQVHRPETCYPATGFAVTPPVAAVITIGGRQIPGQTLVAQRHERRDRVLWWTRIGTAFPLTVWDERREILSAALRREVVDGVLVRLSTPDAPDALPRLQRQAAELVARSAQSARTFLIGHGAVA